MSMAICDSAPFTLGRLLGKKDFFTASISDWCEVMMSKYFGFQSYSNSFCIREQLKRYPAHTPKKRHVLGIRPLADLRLMLRGTLRKSLGILPELSQGV